MIDIKELAKRFTKKEFIELFGEKGLDLCPSELGLDDRKNCDFIGCSSCLEVAIYDEKIKFKNE